MASHSRNRRRSPRGGAGAFVAPVLDLSWQSPYVPAHHEREHNLGAVRRVYWRRQTAWSILVALIVIALVVAAVVATAWWGVAAAAVVVAYGIWTPAGVARLRRRSADLGTRMAAGFVHEGNAHDHDRLDTVLERLTATFGVSGVHPVIVRDEAYNVALVRHQTGQSLLVTTALLRDFDLIELEGAVAHCLARERLGLVARGCAAVVVGRDGDDRLSLAGPGTAFRADEVAAAQIRYPAGLAQALRRCGDQEVPADSYFSSADYDVTRCLWLNPRCGQAQPRDGDLDHPLVRARALEEW